ncbi:MAG: hypothetical protein ONB05_04115 [candidate division KSB1 bacterium]|nr:hypothetical protein [candidate division KSB1 bacterium]
MKSLPRLFLITVLCLFGCNVSVNKTIYIPDGEIVHDSQNTVNGNIIIGSDCKVYGTCRSVNGTIEVGSRSKIRDLQTVNGTIRIGKEVTVRRDVESVNGSVTCEPGVMIEGDITTVNGSMELANTTVKRDITTYHGNITLRDKSTLRGNIIVKRGKGSSEGRRRLRIKITEESVVEGNIMVRDRRMEVKVYLSSGGKVNGRIENAEVIE